jgi:Protein of unknown function (DUF2637)
VTLTQTTDTPNDLSTAAARQAAARAAYVASVAAGQPLTGAALGRQFDRTARWGRMQISKARTESGTPTNDPVQSRLIASVSRNRTDPSPPSTVAPTDDLGRDLTRDDSPHRSWLDNAITLAVALVAAAASYGHMLEVAQLAGEHLWIARAFPITVDGLVLAALRQGDRGRAWLALGAAVSIAANVLAQFPDQATLAGPIVSAWPPLALYGTHRLLHTHRPAGQRPEQQARTSRSLDGPGRTTS